MRVSCPIVVCVVVYVHLDVFCVTNGTFTLSSISHTVMHYSSVMQGQLGAVDNSQ